MPRPESAPARWLAPTWHGAESLRPGARWLGRHVLARGLCRFQWLALDELPPADRLGRVRVELATWAPFGRTGSCALVQGGQAILAAWDEDALEARLGDPRWPRRLCVPESFLVPPGADGTRLLAWPEGYEAQWWVGPQLRASRWWPQAPDAAAWQAFCRGSGMAQPAPLPAAESLLPGARVAPGWGQWVQARATGVSARSAQALHLLGATLLLSATTVAADLGRQALEQRRELAALQAQNLTLRESLAPLAAARREAAELAEGVSAVQAWRAPIEPLPLLAHLSQRLPPDGSRLRQFDWDGSQLRLVLEAAPQTPRAVYVQALEEGGWFEQVREQGQEGDAALVLVTRLRAGAPGAAAESRDPADAADAAAEPGPAASSATPPAGAVPAAATASRGRP